MIKEIYILEDDDGIRGLLEFLLEEEGYKVSSFTLVEKFMVGINKNTPDLALLDICLPDGDGLEVCRELRQKEATRKIPVILMSSIAEPREDTGASDFISKPFDIEELVERIGKQLRQAS